MACLHSEAEARRYAELKALAPWRPRSRALRVGDCFYLAGTLGSEFDVWQHQLATVSAADAYFAQQLGLEEIERVMDELEESLKSQLQPGERLLPRRSPGYPGIPLAVNREILDRLDAAKWLGLGLSDSQLLIPSKSVTAICRVAK